jgi:hypothetical protein
MFFHSNDTLEEVVLQDAPITDSWEQEVVPFLPPNLEEYAFRLGAMSRKGGKIRSASDLLRGILAYVLCVGSFRSLGAWGVLADVADLANTSWRERMRKSCDWLFWLLNELMKPERQEPIPCLKKAGYKDIKLADASQVKCLGEDGKIWRFHCIYSLCTQQLHQVLISSTKVAESVMNFVLEKGVIYVHDSAYGYRAAIAALCEAGAYAVTAFYPKSFPLEDAEGKVFSVIAWLKRQRAKAKAIRSCSAFFWDKGKRYEVRVIALRRTPEQAERNIEKKRKSARKDHRKLQGETIYLAQWVLILTTLPAKDWTAQEVLSLYRARWQIEMLFKRVKQLLRQHRIRAKTDETATATVAAILVSWVLQQEVAVQLRSFLEEMYRDIELAQEDAFDEKEAMEHILSEWRIQQVSVDLFRQQVQGPLTRQRVLECAPQLQRHLRDSPRKRVHQWRRVIQSLVDPEKTEKLLGIGKSRNTGSALTAALA